MKSGKVALGVLTGLAAGAALGILFAPNKGTKTRRRLIGSAKDMAADIGQKIKDEALTLRNKAGKMQGDAQDRLHEFNDGVKEKLEAINHS